MCTAIPNLLCNHLHTCVFYLYVCTQADRGAFSLIFYKILCDSTGQMTDTLKRNLGCVILASRVKVIRCATTAQIAFYSKSQELTENLNKLV